MHIDPLTTDAFNALFRGHKWWVIIPHNFYEFDDQLSCHEHCSDFEEHPNTLDSNQKNEMWFKHILPQLR